MDSRKDIPEEARLLDYSSALQGVELTSGISFSTEWESRERVGEEGLYNHGTPSLCPSYKETEMLLVHR